MRSSTGGSPTISKNRSPAYESPSGSVLAHPTLLTPGTALISFSMAPKNCSSESVVGYLAPSGSTIIVSALSAR